MRTFSRTFTALMAISLAGAANAWFGAGAEDSVAPPIGRKIADFTAQDFLGAKVSLADWADKKAVVVVFLGAECPLSKLYAKRISELSAKYAADGVQFVGINANRQD